MSVSLVDNTTVTAIAIQTESKPSRFSLISSSKAEGSLGSSMIIAGTVLAATGVGLIAGVALAAIGLLVSIHAIYLNVQANKVIQNVEQIEVKPEVKEEEEEIHVAEKVKFDLSKNQEHVIGDSINEDKPVVFDKDARPVKGILKKPVEETTPSYFSRFATRKTAMVGLGLAGLGAAYYYGAFSAIPVLVANGFNLASSASQNFYSSTKSMLDVLAVSVKDAIAQIPTFPELRLPVQTMGVFTNETVNGVISTVAKPVVSSIASNTVPYGYLYTRRTS